LEAYPGMNVFDETLPTINKSKHPIKGEYKEKIGRIHCQEDKRTTQEEEPQRELQVPQPPPVRRSISNKERGMSFVSTVQTYELLHCFQM